jgi:AcrR family transcriptional regulator
VRAAVLDATLAELATSSYGQLRVEDIARRAGVNKTTIYRRWPTKAELVAEAALASSARAVPIPDTGSLAEDLRLLARSVAANIGSEPGRRTVRNFVAAACADDDDADGMAAFWSERIALAGTIVDRAIARGEVADEVDPHLVIETLIGTLYVRLLMTGEPVTTDIADATASIVSNGVIRPAPNAPPLPRRGT